MLSVGLSPSNPPLEGLKGKSPKITLIIIIIIIMILIIIKIMILIMIIVIIMMIVIIITITAITKKNVLFVYKNYTEVNIIILSS